ncbi:MAG: hypothetical protein RLZZ152_221, partial [Pseudomonadota bacterium]
MAIDKARILKHLQTEVYCRLGVSPIHGIGVFAIRDIPKGTQPLVSLLKIKEFSFSKKEIPQDISEVKIKKDEIKLTDFIVLADQAKSIGDARRKVEQGGVEIDSK